MQLTRNNLTLHDENQCKWKKNKSHASTMKLLPLIISYRKTNKTEKKIQG